MTNDLVLLLIGIALVFGGVSALSAAKEMKKLKLRVQNLEQQLKDFDVIPQTFDSSKSQ